LPDGSAFRVEDGAEHPRVRHLELGIEVADRHHELAAGSALGARDEAVRVRVEQLQQRALGAVAESDVEPHDRDGEQHDERDADP